MLFKLAGVGQNLKFAKHKILHVRKLCRVGVKRGKNKIIKKDGASERSEPTANIKR